MEKRNIVVLGMHRSGTSLMARLLAENGWHPGPENDLEPSNSWNSDGYYESRTLMSVNDYILHQAGARWDEPMGFSPDDISGDVRKRSVARLLREMPWLSDSNRPWVIKDPRLCLTLPVVERAFSRVHYVLMVRRPLAVAQSIKQRDGLSETVGIALWDLYMRFVRRALKDRNAGVLDFDDLITDPQRALQDIPGAADMRTRGIREASIAPTDTNDLHTFSEQVWRLHSSDWTGLPDENLVCTHVLKLFGRARHLQRSLSRYREQLNELERQSLDSRGALAAVEETLAEILSRLDK